MTQFRVFDEETATRLVENISTADSIELKNSGEFFSANPGEVILAPSIQPGEVLYIRIKSAARNSAPTSVPAPSPTAAVESAPVAKQESKHYVATGFLGLDGELEEEIPETPKPWWKKLID